ncbi:MFS transporter [Actinoplanes philippinensis]|uniref:Na+/melibiose symporter n=1 Tax=Actinoplanes philippinensis TaxID=35752 RepID=A0A1I2EI99_9ACTN|nr:MFS transporter [Actinoplanes philippinensis]GIE76988.1 MFS transporter [Actinoplanes philippinensis]SFE92256.1 Na+/melibiose symporter [Actinoplanes philippinensis]
MVTSTGQSVAKQPGNLLGFPGAVWLLLTGDLVAAAAVGLTQPYLVVYLHGVLGVPLALATGAVALAAVASLVGNPVAGTLIDRWGGRAVMCAGLALAATGMLLLGAGHGLVTVAVSVALTGFGWSLSMPALGTRLATLTGEHLHQRVYTLQYVLFNVGLAAGAAVGGLVVGRAGSGSPAGHPALPALWVAAALVCLVSIGLAVAAGPGPARPHREAAGTGEPPEAGYRQALADRRLLPILGAATLLSTVGYGIYNAAPSLLAVAAGDPSALAWLSVANAVTVIAGAPIAWRFADRLPARAALLCTAGLWALAWAVCVPTAAGGGLPTRTALVGAAVLTGAGELLFAGALPTLVNAIAPDEIRGRYNALSTLSLTVGMAAGPLLTSVAAAVSGTVPLLCAAVALAAGAALLVRLRAPAPEESS